MDMEETSESELALEYRVHESLKNCAVAKDTEAARDILANLFDSASREEMDTMRYMLIEVCVCVFHGFSSASFSQDKDTDKERVPQAVTLIPKQTPKQGQQLEPSGEQYRESHLGREPLTLAAVGIEQADENFQYDEYSDDSHGETSYSDSDFGATLQEGLCVDTNQEPESTKSKTKAEWAAVLSEDIHRQHVTSSNSGGGSSLASSGRLSATGSPNAKEFDRNPPNSVTCDDLFQALVSNVSTVVLPKVPSMAQLLNNVSGSGSDTEDIYTHPFERDSDSDMSSSLAETISESSSIPSQQPASVTLYSNMEDKEDGYALSSLCSDENLSNLNTYNDGGAMKTTSHENDDEDDDDSSGFHSETQDQYSDSPPHFRHPSPGSSPNKNINSLLSDNSEVEIDFSEDANGNVLITSSEHHLYQEEQRFLFEQGDISDSGLEDNDEDNVLEDSDDGYECDRYFAADDLDSHNNSRMSDRSTNSSYSNSAAATYDVNLRKLLEATIVDVIVEAGMEMLPTPVKNKLDKHMSYQQEEKRENKDKVLFTTAILKKMCRAVSIELSIELRAPSCQGDDDELSDDPLGGVRTMSSISNGTEDLHTDGTELLLSPSARDIEHTIWPVFAAFLNAEESDDMVVLLVDSLSTLIFDNTLQPLYSGMPDIQGVRTMSEEFDSITGEPLSQPLDEDVDMSLTSLAEVRAAGPTSRTILSPQSSQDQIKEEEISVLKSGSQNSLVNQYIHEIRHHETELHNRMDMSDDDTEPTSHRRKYSIAATVDSHEMEELRQQDAVAEGTRTTRRVNDTGSLSSQDTENDPTAPWNVPDSPMDDLFRRTHNALGSPFRLPVDVTSGNKESKFKQPIQYNNNNEDDNEDNEDNEDNGANIEKQGKDDFNDSDVMSRSPMDDLFRRTHNSVGSPFHLPIGLNTNAEEIQHDDDRPQHHEHHEDEEFYDKADYAQNLYGSGGYVTGTPERHRHTPTDRSIATTDALAGLSVMSHGSMSSSSSTASSSSSPDYDTVSSPLTHDNYNSSPPKDTYHHHRETSEEPSMDEEFSTNSLSMRNFTGDQDDDFHTRGGGGGGGGGSASVSNTSLSSPSISTRRSDAVTVSDLPDNFGGDFFATDNDSLDRLTASGSDNGDANEEENACSYDYDEPTDNPTENTQNTVMNPLSMSNLKTHYSSYEISMLDHLDKIANSPTTRDGVARAPSLTGSISMNSSQGEEELVMLGSEDNLILIPKAKSGEGSPLAGHRTMFEADMDDTSYDNEESESSVYEESDTSTQDERDDEDDDDDDDDEDEFQQPSMQTDAAVVCFEEDQLEFQNERDMCHQDRDYDLYGLHIASSSTNTTPNKRSHPKGTDTTKAFRGRGGGDRKDMDRDEEDSDFSEQIPLPGESFSLSSSHRHHSHEQHEHPTCRHSQHVMSPSELHVSQHQPRSHVARSPPSSTGQNDSPSNQRKQDIVDDCSSGNSSPHSIYSSRLAQNIPLTSFSQILYNNHKTASQSYSENSDKSGDDDGGFISPPQFNDYQHQSYQFAEGNDSKEELCFSNSDAIRGREDSYGASEDINRSLNLEEEAAEDIRLFNDIVASIGTIDPNDETAQTNAFFMAELMKSTLDDTAMSFFKGPLPPDNRQALESNPFFDGDDFLNMETVGHKLDSIVQGSTKTVTETNGNVGETSTGFDQFGLQVTFDTALSPSQYDASSGAGAGAASTSKSKPKSSNKNKEKREGETVSGDILMTNMNQDRSKLYADNDEESVEESESEFERSSSHIRSMAIRQFGDMVERYGTPMDLSPLKKRQPSTQKKDFIAVVNSEDAQYDYDTEVYDHMRESTVNAPMVHNGMDGHHNPYLVAEEVVQAHQQAYNAQRPSTARVSPKVSLKGTTPTTTQRKVVPPPQQSPETTHPSLTASSSKKSNKKQTSSSFDDKTPTVTSAKKKTLSVSTAKKPPVQQVSHIVVIPPVPLQLDDNSPTEIYTGSRDVYVGPTSHSKFGVDFSTATNRHILPGGNPPPAFSPSSPRKAANAITGCTVSSSRRTFHSVPSSQQPTISSATSAGTTLVSGNPSVANGTHSQSSHNSNTNNTGEKRERSRPKSAPRQRTPSKAATITSNSATAAMAAQRAAKDPASLLRKSTSALPSGSGKRSSGQHSSRHKRNTTTVSRSMDDSHIRYQIHAAAEGDASNHNKPTTTRMSSRQQAKKMQHLTAPTFSSAVRTLDIAGVDIATVQALAAAGPVGNVTQLSISGGCKKHSSRARK